MNSTVIENLVAAVAMYSGYRITSTESAGGGSVVDGGDVVVVVVVVVDVVGGLVKQAYSNREYKRNGDARSFGG